MTERIKIGVTPTQRLQLSTGLHASLRVLRADSAELTRFLEEQAAENPALILRPVLPDAGDWLPRWSGILPDAGLHEAASLVSHGPSLMAHVLAAIPSLVDSAAERRIALMLADALEPTGWLGRPPDVIAAEARVPLASVQAVLTRLQTMDPPGLFARSLSECLRLQAREAGVLDPVLHLMLDRLDLVAAGDWSRLARLSGSTEPEVQARFRILRSFNPKPGTSFATTASPLREPDLVARPAAGGWQVSLNHSALPALRVDPDGGGAARARDVIRLIETRNATLLSVGQAILSHQHKALDQGPAALRPLTMQGLAQRVGLHKSSVSRVVAGTAVDTPHGTWWLRRLFSADMGADASSGALRARLARLVAQEDPASPLSDDRLAQMLGADGSTLARRTVAKYRADLRIPAGHRRRRA